MYLFSFFFFLYFGLFHWGVWHWRMSQIECMTQIGCFCVFLVGKTKNFRKWEKYQRVLPKMEKRQHHFKRTVGDYGARMFTNRKCGRKKIFFFIFVSFFFLCTETKIRLCWEIKVGGKWGKKKKKKNRNTEGCVCAVGFMNEYHFLLLSSVYWMNLYFIFKLGSSH